MSENKSLPKNYFKVIGQCNDDTYCHDYLNCTNCNVNKTLKCFLPDCPCNGEGFLFPIQGDKTCFSHQMQGHLSSVRVYTTRLKRAGQSVQSCIKKNNKIL